MLQWRKNNILQNRELRHSVLSFSPTEIESINIFMAADIARKTMEYYEEDQQITAAVHTDIASNLFCDPKRSDFHETNTT